MGKKKKAQKQQELDLLDLEGGDVLEGAGGGDVLASHSEHGGGLEVVDPIMGPEALDNEPQDLDGDPQTYEEEARQEIGEVLARMQRQSQEAARRYQLATDFDYVLQVVFISTRQREAFERGLEERLGISLDSISNGPYVNGLALAEALGIELPHEEYEPRDNAMPRYLEGLDVLD